MRLSAEAPSELGQPEDAPAVHDAGDDAYWISAPKGENGEPIWIDFRFNLNKASDVDTVAGTAFIKLDVVLYWTDPRMIGWPEDHADLPPKLWGPTMELVNALGDMQNESLVFSVVDAKTGRMKRAFGFTGVIENPMNLRDFPFDMDDITIMFATRSHWSTFDGETGGDVAKGMTYRLRQIREEVEGKWLDLSWSGRIGECELHGVSTRVDELSTSAQGQDQTDVVLSFHVTRKSAFYFWKCLLPLYLLFTLSLSTFHLETDNLEARVSTVSTYCLAAFATLYVVGEALPKTDLLTKIDTVIVMTTVSLTFTGIASLVLKKVHTDSGADVAAWWNMVLEIALITIYVLANFWIFVPPCLKQLKSVSSLTGYQRVSTSVGASDTDESDLPPTVVKGSKYFTLDDL